MLDTRLQSTLQLSRRLEPREANRLVLAVLGQIKVEGLVLESDIVFDARLQSVLQLSRRLGPREDHRLDSFIDIGCCEIVGSGEGEGCVRSRNDCRMLLQSLCNR